MDNNIANDSSNLKITNDNSFIVLEDILYCSSPNNGIKSKSNIKNKNFGFTQFSPTNDSGIHYTFNIITKPILNEKSESNEQTNDYTILNILNSRSENIQVNKLNLGDKLYEEEKNEDKVRLSKIRNDEDKGRKKKSKTKKILKNKLNAYCPNNFNKNKEKDKDKDKENDVKKGDINETKEIKVKENYVKGQTHNQRNSCINFAEEEKINKKQKGEFYSSSSIKRVEKKEKNIITHKMRDCFSSYHKKQNKKDKIKQAISTRNPEYLKRCSQLNKVKSEQIKYKSKKSESPVNKCKINNLNNINNLQMIKSSKFIEKRTFSLIKESDNDFSKKKHSTIKLNEKKKVKIKDLKLKNKSSKKKDKSSGNTKVNDKKAISYKFFDEFKIVSSKNNKKVFKNVFRKQKEKKSKRVNSIVLSSKKADKPIQIENNNEFKSSLILNKKLKKKDCQLEKQDNKKFRRRYTVFKSEHNRNLLSDDCNISSSDDSDKSYNTGYSQETKPIKKELFPDNKIKNMKIGQITEDKLVLNYNDKKEIIEILSDKEKIDDYYEYCDLCLETLKEINIKEVPKSKSKINFKFSKERQKKKIALFDLDETLVHCTGEIKNDNNNSENNKNIKTHKIKVVLPNKKEIYIGVNIRPHWKESLDKIKDIYNIVIFTASHQSYSDAVLNYLDPENKYFNYRLYRDSCVQCKTNDINFYVKDLDIFKDNYDLKDIIMIDNSILSFAYHLNNGIPVVPFYDSTEDSELPLLCFYLLSISSYKDLREANKEHINIQYFFSNNRNEKNIQNEDINEISEIEYKKECNSQNSLIIKSNKEVNNIAIGDIEKSDGVNKRRRSNSVTLLDKNKRNSKINSDINISNKVNDSINYHSISAKKLNNILSVNKKESKITIFSAMKGESSKINVDFLQKWKNAYLKLSLKK